ncbi:MAG: PPC domain-containing protein [Planctomycetes bacterium]|nr:PPC domain-containing protein [Planctomycetota bacterium]
MHTPLVAILAALGLAAAGAAQAATEHEPNDTVDRAQRVLPGTRLHGQLATSSDVDWFAFAIDEPRQVSLRVWTECMPWQAQREALVAIYDRHGHERLAWDERSDGPGSDCGVTLPAGSYTCLVAMKPNGIAGDYVLDFEIAAPRAIDVHEGQEPNDHPSFGGAPVPMRIGDTVAGVLATPDDVDWFTFELSGPGLVQVVCHDDGGVPQLDDTRLQLWRETTPGTWSLLGLPGWMRTSHRVLDLTPMNHLPLGNHLAPGRYAIQVDANTSTPMGPGPWDYRKVGHYALRTAWIGFPGHGPVHEAAEPNDRAAAATPLVLGDDAIGNLDGAGDADWYRIVVEAPTTVGATAVGIGPAPVRVTSLRLLGAAGQTVGSGSGTATAHDQLVCTLAEPGTYFLEVRGRASADIGGYRLHTGACSPLLPHAARRRLPTGVGPATPAEASATPPSPAAPADAPKAATQRSH